MDIEVLVVPDCPNQQLLEELLRQALNGVGLPGTGFTTRVIADQAEAEWSGFTGSPTIPHQWLRGRTEIHPQAARRLRDAPRGP
ncbi:hypothetical protein AB0L49_45545 [Streptomyces antimycoticus]|uniref:hypothetical protein n=1 Tax=Streptomyces antimycoticus TaxID=68175 RepID=UPI003422E1B6